MHLCSHINYYQVKKKYYLFISLYPYTHTDVWSVMDHRAPLSMGFPRQEYWSGVPLPSPFLFLDEFFKIMNEFWISFNSFSLSF